MGKGGSPTLLLTKEEVKIKNNNNNSGHFNSSAAGQRTHYDQSNYTVFNAGAEQEHRYSMQAGKFLRNVSELGWDQSDTCS